MSLRQTVPFLLAGALALAAGCGDDSSPTGGGGGGSQTLSIPSGVYSASGEFFVCGETVPYDAQVDTLVYCSNDLVDEFFGYDCPVKRSGNNLSLSCQRTREVSLGCTETVKIDIKGTVSGDHYELSGTFEYSDNPADCFDGSYCDSLHLTFDRIGNKPPACTYADVNTVALTVTGGYQAGRHVLDAVGNSTNSGGLIAFSFDAFTPRSVVTTAPLGFNGIEMYIITTYVDPAALPVSLSVTVPPPGAGPTPAGGPDVTLQYYENDGVHYFEADSATGTMVVRGLSDDYIAGTMSISVTGLEYSEDYQTGQPAQRTLTGGYYVLRNTGAPANAAENRNASALAMGLRRLAR